MRARLLGVALAALTAAGCNPQAPKPSPGPSPTPHRRALPPALHITGRGTASQPVRMVFQGIHNRIEYDLLASSYESRGPQGKTRAVFQNARVTFHAKDGSQTTASSPAATVDQTTNAVTMTGGVHAATKSGMRLTCDRLVYDHATGMLHGTGHVVVVDPKGFRATGSSFDSDVSLTHMRMY